MEEDGRGDTDIRGSLLSSIILQKVFEMNTKLSEMNVNENERNKIFKHLTKDDNRYATIFERC